MAADGVEPLVAEKSTVIEPLESLRPDWRGANQRHIELARLLADVGARHLDCDVLVTGRSCAHELSVLECQSTEKEASPGSCKMPGIVRHGRESIPKGRPGVFLSTQAGITRHARRSGPVEPRAMSFRIFSLRQTQTPIVKKIWIEGKWGFSGRANDLGFRGRTGRNRFVVGRMPRGCSGLASLSSASSGSNPAHSR